jgi:hypothetical protein
VSKPSLRKKRDKYRLRRQHQKGNQRSRLLSSLERLGLKSWATWLQTGLKITWRLFVELVRFSLRAIVLLILKIFKFRPHQFNPQLNLEAWLKNLKLHLTQSLRNAPIFGWMLLALLSMVALLAYDAITRPSSNAIDCRQKINGLWQTNLGEMNFQEKPNSRKAIATFDYENIDRGRVRSRIEGELNSDILDFRWTELAERGKLKTQGQGILFFRNQCQEFYGSYSSISLQNRGLQGLLTKAIAVK